MSFNFVFGRPKTKKQRRREQIRENRRKGEAGEDDTRFKYQLWGYDVERTGRGHDFRVTQRDILTGKIRKRFYVERKTGNANLTELQRKMKRKYKDRYVVERGNPVFY